MEVYWSSKNVSHNQGFQSSQKLYVFVLTKTWNDMKQVEKSNNSKDWFLDWGG